MMDKITLEYWIETGFVGCEHKETLEIDRKEWESMSQHDKDMFMGERYNELIDIHIYGRYKIVED